MSFSANFLTFSSDVLRGKATSEMKKQTDKNLWNFLSAQSSEKLCYAGRPGISPTLPQDARGLHQGASSSPEQNISFVFVSLAALPMNIPSSGQESTCCIMHSCHAGLQGSACGWGLWQQDQCSAMVGAPLLKGLLSVAGMTGWQRSDLIGATSFLLPIPHYRCGWLRNQGWCCPKYLPCHLTEEKKSSCLCCKMGAMQVKLWGKVRPKPHVMISCSLHAPCQVWSPSQTTLRKVPSPHEIEGPKKYHLLLAEDQTVRTYGKATQLRQRICCAAGFLHCNQPRRLHLTCGLFKEYNLTVFCVLSHSDHELNKPVSLLFLPHGK